MITDPKTEKGPFGTIKIGKTGQYVSRICMGTMTFGNQLDASEAHAILDFALERGLFYIDTANAYSGGESEKILGSWLKTHRQRVVISTKVRYQVGADLFSVGLSRRTIKTEVEQSLRRLQTDNIDILFLHQPDIDTSDEEILRSLEELIREGKIHHYGLSNFSSWQTMRLDCCARINTMPRPALTQSMYNLLVRTIENELVPCCRDLGMTIYAYNPLAAGLLTGKYQLGDTIRKGGRFDILPYYQERYWKPEYFNAVEQLAVIAQAANRSIHGLALQFIIDSGNVDGLVIGASSLKQLKDNLDSIGEPLPGDVITLCDGIWDQLKGPSPSYYR